MKNKVLGNRESGNLDELMKKAADDPVIEAALRGETSPDFEEFFIETQDFSENSKLQFSSWGYYLLTYSSKEVVVHNVGNKPFLQLDHVYELDKEFSQGKITAVDFYPMNETEEIENPRYVVATDGAELYLVKCNGLSSRTAKHVSCCHIDGFESIEHISFSRSRPGIFAACSKNELGLFKLEYKTNNKYATYPAEALVQIPYEGIDSLAFNPNKDEFAVAKGNKLQTFTFENWTFAGEFERDLPFRAVDMSFSPDNKHIAAAFCKENGKPINPGLIDITRISAGIRMLSTINAVGIAYSPKGNYLALSTKDSIHMMKK